MSVLRHSQRKNNNRKIQGQREGRERFRMLVYGYLYEKGGAEIEKNEILRAVGGGWAGCRVWVGGLSGVGWWADGWGIGGDEGRTSGVGVGAVGVGWCGDEGAGCLRRGGWCFIIQRLFLYSFCCGILLGGGVKLYRVFGVLVLVVVVWFGGVLGAGVVVCHARGSGGGSAGGRLGDRWAGGWGDTPPYWVL